VHNIRRGVDHRYGARAGVRDVGVLRKALSAVEKAGSGKSRDRERSRNSKIHGFAPQLFPFWAKASGSCCPRQSNCRRSLCRHPCFYRSSRSLTICCTECGRKSVPSPIKKRDHGGLRIEKRGFLPVSPSLLGITLRDGVVVCGARGEEGQRGCMPVATSY